MTSVLTKFMELTKPDQKELAAAVLNVESTAILEVSKSDTPEKHDPDEAPHIKVKTEHGQVYYLALDPNADLDDDDLDADVVVPDAETLEEMTVPQLKDLAGQLDLKKSGSKPTIIERIVTHQATTPPQ